ncbi:MAG: hypothetical protein EXR39_06430 [Betaproteobacteria bacterium]|nr:hypothetical protein [Betaproteobacteria bacterium]
MTGPTQEEIRAYVNALAAVTGDRPHDAAHLNRIATALPALLALSKKIGPWPVYLPSGPLDPGI